jgi:hypothetical protein
MAEAMRTTETTIFSALALSPPPLAFVLSRATKFNTPAARVAHFSGKRAPPVVAGEAVEPHSLVTRGPACATHTARGEHRSAKTNELKSTFALSP